MVSSDRYVIAALLREQVTQGLVVNCVVGDWTHHLPGEFCVQWDLVVVVVVGGGGGGGGDMNKQFYPAVKLWHHWSLKHLQYMPLYISTVLLA